MSSLSSLAPTAAADIPIGYLNLRILLFGSILLTSTHAERSHIPGSYDCIQQCLDSAKKTIEIIYETYKHHEFFRTWSVLLLPNRLCKALLPLMEYFP